MVGRYRLECRSLGQAWQTIAETSVVVPPMDLPSLASARPNPFNPRTEVPAGEHVGIWDGRDARGGALPSGTYFCLLTTAWGTQSTKMILVR